MTKPAPTNEAFARFREMTKRIVNTPKALVDARAKAEKQRKAAAKPA
jgi:hypothetical protein